MSFLKAKQGQYKDAYKHLNEARIRSHQYVSFIDDMYRHELEDCLLYTSKIRRPCSSSNVCGA